MINGVQIITEKFYNPASPDSLQRTAIVWTQKFLDDKLEEQLRYMIDETVRLAVAENTDVREQIKKAVENAITTMPLAVLEESVRQVIKQELAEMKPKTVVNPDDDYGAAMQG